MITSCSAYGCKNKCCKGSNLAFHRTYAVRRVKDSFREHKDEADVEKIQELISYGKSNLEIIKRQIIIGKMYQSPDLVIEHNMQMGEMKTLEGG